MTTTENGMIPKPGDGRRALVTGGASALDSKVRQLSYCV